MGGCEAPTGRRSTKARLLEQALAIEAVDARSAGELGFMPRIFVQATLPHSRPKAHEFERVNGKYSLHLTTPPSVGLPCGSSPRLVVAWLTTEAVRTKSPEIRLGPTFSQFMYSLGLTPVTGKRGTVSRMRVQLHRLFSTTIRWTYTDEARGRASGCGLVIAGEHQLWWSPRDQEQKPFWRSRVVLGREFFDEVTHSCHSGRSAPSPAPQTLASRHRYLPLAHLPDELSAEAVPHPLGGAPKSVWSRLRPATGLPPEVPWLASSRFARLPSRPSLSRGS